MRVSCTVLKPSNSVKRIV